MTGIDVGAGDTGGAIDGGTAAQIASPADTSSATAGAPPAPGEGAAALPGAGSPDLLAEPPANQAVFDRGYVESVRREAERYREEARTHAEQLATYNDAFSPYEPADRDVWLDLARRWVTDPADAARVMQQIASQVLDEQTGQTAPAASPTSGEVAEDGPLTPERVQQMMQSELAARDEAARQQQAVEGVFAELRAAGFDPQTRDGFAVLWTANNETNGDVAKAIELVKADRQKIIDDYVAGRANGTHPTPAPNGLSASQSTPITNLDDAHKATQDFLRSRNMA